MIVCCLFTSLRKSYELITTIPTTQFARHLLSAAIVSSSNYISRTETHIVELISCPRSQLLHKISLSCFSSPRYIASDMIPERVFRNSPPFFCSNAIVDRSIAFFVCVLLPVFSKSPFVIVKEDFFISFSSFFGGGDFFSILTSCGKVICRWQLERGKVRADEEGCSRKTARNIAHASLCSRGEMDKNRNRKIFSVWFFRVLCSGLSGA